MADPWVQPGEVLLHIGPQKTGTTALQASFAASRDRLLMHGVAYPGTRESHWHAAAAFLERRVGGGFVPGRDVWDDLLASSGDPDVRTFISSELFCEATDADVASLAEALGPHRLRVVLVVRSLERLLPSSWQQAVKNRGGPSYGEWLDEVLAQRAGELAWRRFDVVALVRRWVGALGRDRVAAVVFDDSLDEVMGEVTALLGLSPDVLVRPRVSNRSLTPAEAELIRQVYGQLDGSFDARLRQRWLRRGGIHRMVEQYRPPADQQRIVTPAWAGAQARAIQADMNAEIRRSGIVVVGDLDRLLAPEPFGASAPAVPDEIPITAAAELVAGILQAAGTDERTRQRELRRVRRRLTALQSSAPEPQAWHRRAAQRLRRHRP